LRYFTLILCLLIGSCATPDSDAIRFGLASAPINLDPRFATDATSERINRLLYARLVDFDERARPAPSLASWQKLSALHYRPLRVRIATLLQHQLAMAASSLEQQAGLYARLQAYLLEQLAYVPLWYEHQYFAARGGIEGYALAADGNYDALVHTMKGVNREIH